MLIVTRKKDQSVRIGEGIVVAVVEINGNEVRIGITAPKDVNIVRSEIAYKEPDNV